MNKRVTLRDLARATKVHFTTVGLALRGDPRVSASTQARVLAAARKLGYHQDAMLSALSTYRHRDAHRFAGVIACITTYTPEQLKTNSSEQKMLAGARAQARAQGFELELFQLNAPGMTPERMSQLLRARGIQGVLLAARLPLPGPMPDLDWDSFSTVAVGYSITQLRVHRACVHHAHNIRLAMQVLQERGYRRIGLVLPYDVFERSLGIVPGSYLAQQYLLPEADRVVPLIAHQVTKASLGRWLRSQRIDCVMLSGSALEMQAWIRELGYEVPGDMGLCLAGLYGKTDGIAGIDNQMELLGDAAVSFIVTMLQHNERGLAVHPRSISIEGRWVDRPTVRPAPAASKPLPAGAALVPSGFA